MKQPGLAIDLKVGESVSIDGGRITMTLDEKSGKRARVVFIAPADVKIRPVKADPVLEAIGSAGRRFRGRP